MSLLFRYLRGYWSLVALALFMAAINQVFSLLDPLIFRHVIDDYATKYDHYSHAQFFRGVTLLLSMAVGVAFTRGDDEHRHAGSGRSGGEGRGDQWLHRRRRGDGERGVPGRGDHAGHAGVGEDDVEHAAQSHGFFYS